MPELGKGSEMAIGAQGVQPVAFQHPGRRPVQQQKREQLQCQGPTLPSLERPCAQRAPLFTEAAQPCLAPDGTRREPVQRILHPALGGALA